MMMTADSDSRPASDATPTRAASVGGSDEPTIGTAATSTTSSARSMSSRLRPFTRLAAPLTPRTGRLTVASIGVLAMLAALVTLVLGIVGVTSYLVPVICLAITAASVALLRLIAIRVRRARVQQAFTHAMSPVRRTEPARRPVVSAPQRPTSLFDAEASASHPLTPMELRTAALASAGHRGPQNAVDDGASAHSRLVGLPAGATAWVPVELPRPTYVDAAKAERDAPAPLDLPEAPRATTRTPIRTSEAAARAVSTNNESDAVASAGPATGRINLDDVLQRRRA